MPKATAEYEPLAIRATAPRQRRAFSPPIATLSRTNWCRDASPPREMPTTADPKVIAATRLGNQRSSRWKSWSRTSQAISPAAADRASMTMLSRSRPPRT